MTRDLEYLRDALEEAEAAARSYAERSPTAAAAFSDEIDAAEFATTRLPERRPPFEYGTIERLTVDRDVCGGRPCSGGQRVRAKDVLEDEDIDAVLALAARKDEHSMIRPT